MAAVAAFSLGVTALSRNLRNKLVLYYALLCGVTSAWAFSFFLEQIYGTGTFYKFHLLFNLALGPVGVFFVRALTRVRSPFSLWLFRVSLVYAVVVGALEWTGLGETPVVRNLAFFAPSFLLFECVHLAFLDWRYRGEGRVFAVGITRKRWLYAGALLLLGSAVMDHVPILGAAVPTAGNILLCLYLFVISEVIIHQRLLDVGRLVNRMLVLIFISLCFTLIYVVLVGWIEGSPGLFLLNTFLASFIILMLAGPIEKLTRMSAVRLFSRKYLKFESDLREAGKALTGILDTGGLAALTFGFLEKTMHFEAATFFVLRSDGTKFRRIRGVRDDELSNREILASHPIVEFFEKLRLRGETPAILDHYLSTEIDRSATEAQRQTYDLVLKGLVGLDANLAIPFLEGGAILGFVVLRGARPLAAWGGNWGFLSLIDPFFVQAGRVLRNMDVYVRLREKDRLAALGEMAAGLAHEIRNPLGAIKGAAQYLATSETAGTPQSPFLEVIVEEVNRLNRVVTQFLDYSRPRSADMGETDVGHVLERTHALFRDAGAGAGVGIELVEPGKGFRRLPRVSGNPEQIKQVMVNLVRNGIQAGGNRVRIGAEAENGGQPGQGSGIVLFVEDNGRGIPRENMEKIFIPFFTTSPGGTGLGLSICSRIVESHGGRIEVASEEGKFTRFSVHLPVIERESGALH